MKHKILTAACLLALVTSACQPGFPSFPFGPSPTPRQSTALPGTPTSTPPEDGTTPVPVSTATPRPPLLRIWIPPQFDPGGSSPSARLLKARLDAYSQEHPEIALEIRVKGGANQVSLLETLSLTRSAAPAALPDLVALPRAELEAAALKGILHSPDGMSEQLASPDWYPYARQSGHVQNTPYGLPFAGDALVIAYHPSQFEHLPNRWEELFVAQKSLALYADDPNGLLLLSLYLSTGSQLLDSSNRPSLDQEALARVLQMIRKGRLIPLQSEEAVWTAFVDHRAQLAVVWASRVLQEPLKDTALMPLTSPDETPFSLATTWSWALAGSDPQYDDAALELAAWLSEPAFMAEWDQAAGYLSPRPTALKTWDEKASLDLISQSAAVIPGSDLLAAVGPILGDALARTLAGEAPEQVARSASEALQSP